MYPVSQEYRQKINLHRTEGVRNRMYARVYFGQFDSTAAGDASLSATSGMPYADLSTVNGTAGQAASYGTWEGCTVDGMQVFMPDNPNQILRQGWISEAMSDANGDFSSPYPTVTVEFTQPHRMVGITLLFDDIGYWYASEYTVTTYLNNVQVYNGTVTNTAPKSTPELVLESYDKMVIAFTKTSLGGQRVHLQQLLFGIGYTYADDDLISVSLDHKDNPIALELPEYGMSFTLFNEDGRFNVDSDHPVVAFLNQQQTAQLAFGYDLSGDGSRVEWIDKGKFTLKSWNTKGSQATFKCEKSIQELTDANYEKGVYAEATLESLAEAVFADAGVTNYLIASFAPAERTTKVPLPVEKHVALLQLIANAAMCGLTIDRDQKIEIISRADPAIQSVTLLGNVTAWSAATNLTDSGAVNDYALWDAIGADGGQAFLPGSGYLNGGVAWTDEPVDGAYPNSIGVTLDFADNVSFGTLALTLSPYALPDELTVTGYRYVDGTYTAVYAKTIRPASADTYITDAFDRVRRITVLFTKGDYLARLQRVGCSWDSGFSVLDLDVIGNPSGAALTPCSQIRVELFDRTENASGEVLKKKIPVGAAQWLKHDEAFGMSVSAVSGTATATHYAQYSSVTVTGGTPDEDGNIEVTITGKKLTDNEGDTATISVFGYGETVEIQNPLITSANVTQAYLDWLKSYMGSRQEFSFETLGYPHVDAGDKMTYKGEPAYITKHTLTFSGGACRSKFTVRKKAS